MLVFGTEVLMGELDEVNHADLIDQGTDRHQVLAMLFFIVLLF